MSKYVCFNDKELICKRIIVIIISLFERRQYSVDQLLSGTGICVKDIKKEQFNVSPKHLDKLFQNALKIWKENDLSFLVGQLLYIDHSDKHTNSILISKNINSKFSNYYHYMWLSQPWIQIEPFIMGNKLNLLINIDIGLNSVQSFLYEVFASSYSSLFKNIESKFHFPFAKPKDTSQYLKYMGAQLQFNTPAFCISCEELRLQHPNVLQQQGFESELAIQAATEAITASSYQLGLPSKIRQLLSHQNQKLPEISAQVDMSPATMKRRLKEYNLSFSQLQDEACLINALKLLAEHDSKATARYLNHKDTSNFRRIFKRWTGRTPNEFYLWLN